jgi:hypothetical protein
MALALSALAVRNQPSTRVVPSAIDRFICVWKHELIPRTPISTRSRSTNTRRRELVAIRGRVSWRGYVRVGVNRHRGDPAASSAMSAVTPKAQCSLRHVISRPLACPQMEAKTTVTVFTPRSASATRPRSARPPQVRAPWSASSPHPRPPRRSPSSSTPSLRPWRRDALPSPWPRRG